MENINLTGHFLIAMPAMTDPFFAKSVTFICTHSQDGAMGVMINRPTDITYDTLFEKIKVELLNSSVADLPVLYGGPVQPERGFVLHETAAGEWDSTITIAENTALTTSKDILESVAIGSGPTKMLLTLGYAGWTPGQLEDEIKQNSWLSVQAKDIETLHKILYETDYDEKLNATMALLGFDPAMLSDEAGHA
ncbi:YqgE/AlgH family protein [Methylotenera sp.]|uniref:YqgE/AlgH family protein n=1 Tax=Methylotenera sp. TaxID=2051956 RepID=UPI00271C9D7A|nr:YqgE/AlgH family protein [Methylotenera sp.]MDO9204245.1 YqgE/AlgH family protein [Methylotenera sp.]MDO9393560.1 YqgE/AlgH family protein [Methylotenera sp.]MDP1523986.1 YqgE/AlgH family protein [Methylotenera sp.]MDP1659376.1 YqgE/AlgH family protein [Methylotenera sp.]MDP2070389.1 YqgE/AlgH family protein [Methylotenera sp.]